MISTRAVSAIITASTLIKPIRTYEVARLFKIQQGTARSLKEPKRTLKTYNNLKTSYSKRTMDKGNYTENYYNTEISMFLP